MSKILVAYFSASGVTAGTAKNLAETADADLNWQNQNVFPVLFQFHQEDSVFIYCIFFQKSAHCRFSCIGTFNIRAYFLRMHSFQRSFHNAAMLLLFLWHNITFFILFAIEKNINRKARNKNV